MLLRSLRSVTFNPPAAAAGTQARGEGSGKSNKGTSIPTESELPAQAKSISKAKEKDDKIHGNVDNSTNSDAQVARDMPLQLPPQGAMNEAPTDIEIAVAIRLAHEKSALQRSHSEFTGKDESKETEQMEANIRGTRESAAASSSSSSSSSAPAPSPRLRLPLALMPSKDIPLVHIVETDIGLLTLQRVVADPLIMRVSGFMPAAERTELLEAIDSAAAGSSSLGKSASRGSSSVAWTRYTPYIVSLGYDTISPIATMYRCSLRDVLAVHPLLKRIASRVACVCQSPVANVSSLSQVLRYGPRQEFMLHKDDRSTPSFPRGWRLMTALIYLQLEHPQETGGGTIFPSLPGTYRSDPTPGTLLLFRNVNPQTNQLDDRSEHRAEPTVKGKKLCLQCYICSNPGSDGHWD